MTPIDRFERQLPHALTDLAGPRTPAYLTDILGLTARTRQRPAWTSLERLLPVELVTTRLPAPRLPWRRLGVLALIAILSAAMLAAYIGTRPARLPPPFGVAGNGLLAYSKDGDIFTVDPSTGIAKAIVTGPETDLRPVFSPDGTHIAFVRQGAISVEAYDLVIASADGSDRRLITMDPKMSVADSAQFTPDGRAILATSRAGVTRYDLIGNAPPVVIAVGRFLVGEIRPNGAQVLLEPEGTPGIELWIMNADGTGRRFLYRPPLQSPEDLDEVRWSPDGSSIAFTCAPASGDEGRHICLMNPDGTGIRELTDEPGVWVETDLVWAPDGKSIAFNRWHKNPSFAWDVQPIGLVSVSDGTVVGVGRTPAPEGSLFDWSPDGKVLLSLPARLVGSPVGAAPASPVAIDVATGLEQEMPFEVPSNVSWQRVAP